MAAETDDQKTPGDDEERRSGRDRRRPPLTIDLTAEPAAGKDGAPRGTFAGARATVLGWLPRHLDREGWIGLGSAAALGGVVALILVMLLQGVGFVPAPGATAARQAADQARAAADSVAAIERRLTALEAMTEGLPGVRSDLAAASTRIGAVEQSVRAATPRTDVDGLRTDLAAVRARLDQMPPGATPADLNALATRIGRLETAATSTGTASAPPALVATAPGTADVDARLASLSARLEAAEAAIGRLSSNLTPASNTAVATARAAAYDALRRAVDSGRPFAVELDVAAAFGTDPLITGLRPYAVNGIATREVLRADFIKVADAILAASESSDDSLFGRLVAGARGLVSVRPSGPVAGNDPPAVVSRMEAAVARGDLATALRERDALPERGKDASAEWAARATARVAADGFLAPAVTGATGKG